MVRVISVHHFTSQDVSSVQQPAAAVLANEKLLVSSAKDGHQVHVHELNRACKLSHSFQTIGRVVTIVYSAFGDYVATLEATGSGTGNVVRAYMNWADPKVDGAPIRPRIAQRVTPSLQPSQGAALDMIELPQRENPVKIATCPSTGNLIMGAKNVLVIYRYTIRTQETSKAKYVDFEDCIHIFHNFNMPKEIALCEDFVGCLSSSEVHIFKVRLIDCSLDNERNLRSVSMYSVSSSDSSSAADHAGLDPFSSLFLPPIKSGQGHYFRQYQSDVGLDSEAPENLVKVVNEVKSGVFRNITARRQQDSEANDAHLEGFVGNVRRHPQHVSLDGMSSTESGARKVILPEIHRANKEYLASGSPKIMEQTLGPCSYSGASGGAGGSDVIVKLVPNLASEEQDFMLEAEAVTMVHCKLLASEEKHEGLQNLVLKPVYWRELKVRERGSMGDEPEGLPRTVSQPFNPSTLLGLHSAGAAQMANPLQSQSYPHLMSVTAMFTSQNEGYLYHLPGHLRKPGRGCGVRRVATYPFTGPVIQIALEPTLMHALTLTGLETYTLRSGFYTVMEAERLDNVTNACPSGDAPICLVGLRPFLGARILLVSNKHLILLASPEDDLYHDGSFSHSQGGAGTPGSNQSEAAAAAARKWTVYSLALPSPVALYKDMVQLANVNRALSPQGYFQLLCEAHVVLRTSIHHINWKIMEAAKATTTKGSSSVVSPDADDDESADLVEEFLLVRKQYNEACLQLANYYALSVGITPTAISSSDWKLALPYFRMSAAPPIQILREAREALLRSSQGQGQLSPPLPPGLLHYITEIVLNPVGSHHPGPSTSSHGAVEDVQEASLADLVIELLGKCAIERLAIIVLKSPQFRQFKTSQILDHFRRHLESSLTRRPLDAAEVVAFAMLCLDRGEAAGEDVDRARSYLQRVPPLQLSELLIEYHDLLVDDISSSNFKQTLSTASSPCFSDMAILIRDSVPDTFVEVLVSLIKAGGNEGASWSLSDVLALFICSFVSTLASNSLTTSSGDVGQSSGLKGLGQVVDCSATHNTAMLQLFLETYFAENFVTFDSYGGGGECQPPVRNSGPPGHDSAIRLDENQLQALHTLIRSYLTSLSVPVRFGERNLDYNIFGPRKLYLDRLPPFDSLSSSEDASNISSASYPSGLDPLSGPSSDSPDFWCQSSLLKLQSLLCAPFCNDPSCFDIVSGFLDIKPSTIGALSLRILCCEQRRHQTSFDGSAVLETVVVPMIADQRPEALLHYAKETDFNARGWKAVLKCLQDRLTNEEEKQELHEVWYATLQEVLDHLAQTLTLDAFLDVLPTSSPHNNEDFQGHIQICRKNQKANQIQSLIVSTGHQLLATLKLEQDVNHGGSLLDD